MSARRSRSRRRWLLILGMGAVLALVGLRWFDLHPIELSVPEPRTGGRPFLRSGQATVALLLIPDTEPATTFDASRWAYAWWNALEQEFGPVDVVDLREPAPAVLPWRNVVVAGPAPPGWESALRQWTAAGGRLLVDPCGAANPWGDGNAEDRRDWEDLLPGAPAAALQEIAPGNPVLTRTPLGSGRVTRLVPCGGRLLQSLQQGRPEPDFSVVERAGHEGLRTPVDLAVLAPELSTVPVADLLERRLLDLAFGDRPLLGIWHVPEGRPGAYLPSHDEESYGDRTLFQSEHEKSVGALSSFFIIPGEMTSDALTSLCRDGFDVGLHWDRGYPDVGRERLGIGRFRPFWREITLESQKQALESSLPESCTLAGNRNHGLLWTEDYAGVLERLASAGFRYDSTYGPDGARYGYVFGTALPFRPLDRTGLPLPILEIPFHFQDDEFFSTELLVDLMTENARAYQGHLGLLAHPTTMGYRPSVDRFEGWLESYRLARELELWIGTHAALTRFWEGRAGARIAMLEGGGYEVTLPGSNTWIWVRPADTPVTVDGARREPDRVLTPQGVPPVALYAVGGGNHRIEMP